MNEPSRRDLVLLTGAALAVRAAFLLLEPATAPVADERTWTNWAVEALVTPRVAFSPLRTRMIFYPPLYPYFIAVPYALFGSLTAVKWLQALVGSLLVPALARLGARSFSARAGWVAAVIAAFYPELVWFSVHFWSETLFMVLLWWGFERLFEADAREDAWLAAAAGLLWGLATLTRETSLYFAPVAAGWLVFGRRGALRAAVFLGVVVLTVAPWTYRNWLLFRGFVPVSTAGGLNLYQGNAPLSREEVYKRYEAVQGRLEQYRWARQAGMAAILDRQPAWIFEKLRDEMPNFWEADSQAVIHIKRGAYGWPVRPWIAVGAAILVLAPYLGVLALFVAGVAATAWTRASVLLISFLVYYNLLHVVTHGYARYRLPAMPVVFLFAASAWLAWRAGELARSVSPPRRLTAAALAVVLALSLVPSFRTNLGDPAFSGVGREDSPSESAPGP